MLRRFDLAEGTDERVVRLPSVDVVAPIGGGRLAYVTTADGDPGDEDFVPNPELHVRELNGNDTTIGPGLSPLWHPDADRLAYLEPQQTRVCEGEVCEESSSVVVADVEEQTRRTVLPPGGGWTLLGWLGDDLVVADREAPSTVLVRGVGEVEKLDPAPNEFWGGSPDGRWIVRVSGDEAWLESPREGSRRRAIDFDGRALGEGAWAPKGDRFAAVILGRTGAELGLVGLSGEVQPVEGSRGASGPILWSPEGRSFVYTRSDRLRLEAVHCKLEESCETLFSWPRGVTMLALESR